MSKAQVIAMPRTTGSISFAGMEYLDHLPFAIMLCDPTSCIIQYANDKSRELLREIEHVLHVSPDSVVGSSLDVFHQHPAHARRIIQDPAKLPYQTVIRAGNETLDLNINAIVDGRGRYRYAQLTWNRVTQILEQKQKSEHLLRMIDELPINVMTCEKEDLKINYANKASLETLRRIEAHLPIKADNLVGTSIDIFHKHPEHQRAMLADPKNLPHSAKIRVGPETLQLRVSAAHDSSGEYLGPILTWSVITKSIAVAAGVTEVVDGLRHTSASMSRESDTLLDLSEGSESAASSVSAAAVEMAASFDEISKQIQRAATMSQDAADRTTSADNLVRGLADSVGRIGAVTALIEKIAAQTNLLALNATIEAARVGEAGRGFAIVAQEVKALAVQTANATKEIRMQVEAVQATSTEAATAVSDISSNVGQVSHVFVALAAGVQEQVATTHSVSEMITEVSGKTKEIRSGAMQARTVATEVSRFAERLNGEMAALLDDSSNTM
ncbi:methyl-accepting chemotaxis protein [Roseixanthobacter liquoris]|uniref:methyl-accepting chemotaxis protein n=1 Tax=Roseixanthobacter liquoris TaxID=3119921 RepID=UPI0037297F0D